MLSPDRVPDLDAARHRRRRLRHRAPRHRVHLRALARRSPRSRRSPTPPASPPTELHHLFRRWAGLTPKAFLQALTLDHARRLLRNSASVLDASFEVGLSGPGPAARSVRHPRGDVAGRMEVGRRRADHPLRLPPLAVRHRAGDGDRARARRPRLRRSRRGAGRARRHARPLAEGELCRGRARAPRRSRAASSIPKLWRADRPLRVVLIGTDFEVRVWETLLEIPMGRATTYSDIAGQGRRAEGRARGRRRGRQEPGLVRGAVPPRARQERRPHRLSLGPHPQARDAGLGGGRTAAAA